MDNVPAISTQCTHEEDPECDESECEEDTSGAYEEEADAEDEDEDEDRDRDYRPAKRTRGAAQPKSSSSTPPSHKRKHAKPRTCGSSSHRPKKRGGGEPAEERRCPLCSRTFTRRSDMQRHMALHEKVRVRNFCEFCGKGLSRPDALRRHLNTNITCKEKKNAREGKGEVEIVLGRRRRA